MTLNPFLAWVLLLLLVLLLVSILRNPGFRSAFTKSEPVEDPDDFERLGSFGRLIHRAYIRTIADSSTDPARKLSRGERRLAAARICRVYTRLLDLSAEFGIVQPPAYTPLEILPVMRCLFPDLNEDLATITDSYVRLRYGELPETQYQLDVVERSWLRVRASVDSNRRKRWVRGWCHDKPGCTCS